MRRRERREEKGREGKRREEKGREGVLVHATRDCKRLGRL